MEWLLYFGLNPLKPIPAILVTKTKKLVESSDYFCAFLATKAFTDSIGAEVKEVKISKSGLNKNDLEEEIGGGDYVENPKDIACGIFVSIFKNLNPLISLVPKPIRESETAIQTAARHWKQVHNPSTHRFTTHD